MGSSQSSAKNNPITYEQKASKLGYDFQREHFMKARSSSTVSKRKQQIKKMGISLKGKNVSFISKNDLNRVCFIIVNTYKRPDYHLGVGPMNDASIVASIHHRRGYKIYFLHNSTRDEFLTYFKFFIQNTKIALTIFYAGRTTSLQVNKLFERQKNQCIKAMVFEQGYIIDYDVVNLLVNFRQNNEKIVLISDCCHGGPIWDFDSLFCSFQTLPSNIISISVASNDNITDYDKIMVTNDGIFTVCLWKILNDCPAATPIQLEDKMNPLMNKFGLSVVYHATSDELATQTLFL